MLVCSSNAQVFGGNPPSIHWKQINTDTARIIFPVGIDSTAQRVSNIVHWLAKYNPAALGSQVRKINIVLQTQTTISNAYVSLAPFRSEFYLTPSLSNFDIGSINWPEELAVHEFRHVEQFNNFRNGISKLAYYLFGEEGLLVAVNAAVPDWFFEGDAVYNETITTNQGRGRVAFFLNQYKSLWQYNKNYKWMKLRNNSMKDYVPDHYPLGYLMVNYGREKYGLDFWSKVTHDASAFKGLFYPFQKAVKKYAGVDYKTFRQNAFDFYKRPAGANEDSSGNRMLNGASQHEVNQGIDAGINNITTLNTKYVTNYYFPYQLGGDSLLYLKSSYRKLAAFYIRDAKGEHKLRTRDISLDQQFSYRNGKIVYAAYKPDARWGWKNFSEIRILNVSDGRRQTLTSRTKYFTPDISPDGNKIAAVQVLPGGESELHILSVGEGKIIQQFHSAEITLFTDPKFINDSSVVTAVRLNDGRMSLAIANIAVGSVERLTTPSYGVIGYLNVNNGIVYFTASFSGNDELYALRLTDERVYRITRTALGNYFVNATNNKMVWSGFTAEGYQLREMNRDESKWTELSEMEVKDAAVEFPVAHSNELHDILLQQVPNRKFGVEKYKQGGHLFRFHSWRPYFEDPDFTYSIYSDNILNTFSTELFYHYNRSDKSNGVGVNLVYGGLYPFINGGIENTFDQPVVINSTPFQINKLEARVGLNFPFDFTNGRTIKILNVGTNYVHQVQNFKGADSLDNHFGYLHHYLSWSHYTPQAVQHIYPRLGYSVSMNYRYAISLYNSYQFITNAFIYLPGFFPTHSIVLNGSFQQRDTTNIIFSNSFANARGYDDYYLSRMWRASVNYHFPIVYPDWGFGNILYFQRIRGNAFYDFEKVYSRDKTSTQDLRSVGGEIYLDTKWWNEYPLTFGFRISHLLDVNVTGSSQQNVFEILIPIVIPQ